jgi:hypothetical protein
MTFDAIRVLISDLRPGVFVFNGSGTNDGTPYVQSNLPMPPGGSVDLTIEYSVPDFQAPNPTLAAQIVQPIGEASVPSGVLIPVSRALRMANGDFLLEFASLSGRTYFVQYSGDMKNWKTALPSVTGTGSRVQWLDNGPPRTESLPTSMACRFYRVLMAP